MAESSNHWSDAELKAAEDLVIKIATSGGRMAGGRTFEAARELACQRNALLEAAEKVIEMTLQYAQDKHGHRAHGEKWSCVTTLRAAIARCEGR